MMGRREAVCCLNKILFDVCVSVCISIRFPEQSTEPNVINMFRAAFVQDHSENPLGAAVTLAHELGHNFGMNHDTPERGCGCRMTVDRGGCIMTPSTG